jgi:hypothetical protein
MNWLNYAFLAAYYIVAFGAAVGFVVFAVLAAKRPILAVVPYCLLILYFPNASWGLVDVDPSKNIYTRGTGQLFFSLLNIYLFALAGAVFAGTQIRILQPLSTPLRPFVAALVAIFILNLPIGLALDYSIFRLLHNSGLMQLMNMFLMFYVLKTAIQDKNDLKLFMDALLFAAVTRGCWGAIRYAALGGDPANFYANFQHIDVKITFFDINDGCIATVAAFMLAWRLIHDRSEQLQWRQIFRWMALILELFIIVFSFRRTGWIGFALAALVFAFVQQAATRNAVLLMFFAGGVPALIYQTLSRMASSRAMEGAGFLEKLAPDIFSGGEVTARTGRFVELNAAWNSISEYPFLGLGLWGAYRGEGIPDLAFHKGDFTWMHSGVLHIWLKTGFIGVALMFGIWVSYARFVTVTQPRLMPIERGWCLASAAGLLFYLPTWVAGTPVIEYRTMQINGILMALPFAIHALALREGAQIER